MLTFFADVATEIPRSWVKHIKDDSPKVLIWLLIPNLEPDIIRDVMKEKLEFWTIEKEEELHTVTPGDHAGGDRERQI